MSATTIRIRTVCRTTSAGDSDTLTLEPGVNVIVGDKSTGKTAWLNTISFLLGDTDTAEEALKTGIAEKYDTAILRLKLGGEDATIERRWKEAGVKSAVIFDGIAVKKEEFSQFFLQRLNIPVVRFPKGNPYSGSKWPNLSWRMLFRHIYRQERFWSDLADKQPDKEQHACIAQFLGVAEKLYPAELGQEIDKHRELITLQARKEQFEEILQQAARDIVPDPAITNSPTLDGIDRGVTRLRAEIDQFRTERAAALEAVLDSAATDKTQFADVRLAERRGELSKHRDAQSCRLDEVEKRFAELSTYREQVKAELGRLRRAEAAVELLKPLSVTCCPYCDQRVTAENVPTGCCFVCRQPMQSRNSDAGSAASKRIAFEVEQLEGEQSELEDLISRLDHERKTIRNELQRIDIDLAECEVQLRPVRVAVAAVLPPELAILDTQIGQWEEKIAQLMRLRQVVERRNELSKEIDRLTAEVDTLGSRLESKSGGILYEQLSDMVSDGINDYLNLLKEGDQARWPHPKIRFDFGERTVQVRVGSKPWTSLSYADQGYVLLGYHYALLNLSGKEGFNYPGIGLIDFPINFGDKTSVADRENFLIEPFVFLAKANPQVQVIVCGRSFAGLEGVHRIELIDVWQQGSGPEESMV